MITQIITFWGTVQGVGFRPTVARLAASFGIYGQVRNMGGLVQLIVTENPARIDAFISMIEAKKPFAATIVRIERKTIDTIHFSTFSIAKSSRVEDETIMIPADIAVCPDCMAEYYDAQNPRYKHPFISCTACGPRFTIMDRLPYDRDTTAMDDFEMCDFCATEYQSIENRRYHAQTISCHDCGPIPEWYVGQGAENALCHDFASMPERYMERKRGQVPSKYREPISAAVRILKSGGVIALKGVGGYYFACSPFDAGAVARLREIKIREHKPFAVMFRDIESVGKYCRICQAETDLLNAPGRPIVLLERSRETDTPQMVSGATDSFGRGCPTCQHTVEKYCRICQAETDLLNAPGRPIVSDTTDRSGPDSQTCKHTDTPRIVSGVAGSSRYIGAFLPSMALQYMILDETGPLIMTSANLSDMPIIIRDDEMFALADREPLLSGVLYNRRRISVGIDDTVIRVIDGQPQMIRRSKGWTPIPVFVRGTDFLEKGDQIFAVGGQLKSAFCFSKGSFSCMSQYFGDLDSVEAENVYQSNVHRMLHFFGVRPDLIICDMHPRYYTTQFAEAFDSAKRIPVQHHHAHIASVMAEHGLHGPVIGVSFDGTGYGTDGAIWGGEILLCEGAAFDRYSHLRYVDMIGGDSSMKEGWKSAICHAYAWELAHGNGLSDKTVKSADRSDAMHRASAVAPSGEEEKRAALNFRGDVDFEIDISNFIAYCRRNRILADYESDGRRAAVETALCKGINTVKTASMGRLFDAVASLLGIHHENRYEGECAIMLENAAWSAKARPGVDEAADLALSFHRDVASAIFSCCEAARQDTGSNQVALSGGVFQNRILMEECLCMLRDAGFQVFYNTAVPPNDGGLALGQNYIGMQYLAMGRR